VKIALAQINPTVGDFTGNLEKIVAASRRAAALGARLTVFSELVVCGYPPASTAVGSSRVAAANSSIAERQRARKLGFSRKSAGG
jgi:predicted amidohydrolase